jgi:hypothetical protein
MNKGNTTENHIGWTTKGLNIFLNIYNDIEDLQIIRFTCPSGFVAGTVEDVGKMYMLISRKLSTNFQLMQQQNVAWQPRFFFQDIPENILEVNHPSILFELSWTKVQKWYVKHQNMWDDAEQIELFDQNEDDEDEQNEEEEEEEEIDVNEDDF